MIKNSPAPWGELKIPNLLTITFPSAEMQKVDDMESVARFYAKAMQCFLNLTGIPKTEIEERVVFDKDFSGGTVCLPSVTSKTLIASKLVKSKNK
jgi:hypothetical protein